MKGLLLFSIMRLDEAHIEHIDEICEDIRWQYENGVSTCPLFSMTLVPEGNPVIDKAKILSEKYMMFKERLDKMGVPSGILMQATIGHGWTLGEFPPFQRYVNFKDGEITNTMCPYDEGFREYIYKAAQTLAKTNPDHIMLDDDLRLMMRWGNGCFCDLHKKRFLEFSGISDITREELWEIVTTDHPKKQEYTDIMVETQKESILPVAKAIRAGIDSVNPKIPGSFCCVGINAEFGGEIAQIMAGEGNPVVVRINNANYVSMGPKFFSGFFHRAAEQIEKLKGIADVILAETDTCPQNRYSTGAQSLHTHFVGTILEGAGGAKQWITRGNGYEPESGKAYRKILAKYAGFYKTLASIVPTLSWRGCRAPVTDKPVYTFGWHESDANAWVSCVLERFGLPVYFSSKPGGVLCLAGDYCERLSDEAILEALGGTVFLASDSAECLIKRGFGKYLGVDVRPWSGKQAVTEKLLINGNYTSLQVNYKELVPQSCAVVADSYVQNTADKVNYENLFPGTTIFKNELGGTVVTFCGTPKAQFNLHEAFAFLTYSRKQQLIKILEASGEMPAYYPGDEDVYFRTADMPDGKLFCAVFNLSMDFIDELSLVVYRDVQKVSRLMPDGSFAEIPFTKNDNEITLDTCANPLNPVILVID